MARRRHFVMHTHASGHVHTHTHTHTHTQVKSAMEKGIVPGGGAAMIHLMNFEQEIKVHTHPLIHAHAHAPL